MKRSVKATTVVVVVVNIAVIILGDDRSFMTMGLVNGLVPLVFKWLGERRSEIRTMGRYSWSLTAIIIYGALLVFVSRQIASLVGGVVLGASMVLSQLVPAAEAVDVGTGQISGGSQDVSALIALGLVSWVSLFFVGLPLLFLSGRLLGRRMDSGLSALRGATIAACAGFIGLALGFVLDALVVGETLHEVIRSQKVYFQVGAVLGSAANMGISIVAFGIGFWRGRLQTVGAYMGYLLGKVSKDVQESVIDLAYQEAAVVEGDR